MASIINADKGIVSGITGIVQTADSTGNLTLQANGVSILTVDTSNSVTVSGLVSASGNITSAGNITAGGNLSLTGNIVDAGALWINTTANGNITLNANGTGQTLITTGLSITGNVLPSANATYDLGSTTARWKTVYTTDLELDNGIGNYTVVEGADDLFLYNNRSGKVFKFALIEVDPATAPPKAKR